jgi:hypothetical protein
MSKTASQITKRLEKKLSTPIPKEQHRVRNICVAFVTTFVACLVAFVTVESFGVLISENIVRKMLGLSNVKLTNAPPGTIAHAFQQLLSHDDFQQNAPNVADYTRRAVVKHQLLVASHESNLPGGNGGSRVLHHPSDKGTDLDKYNIPWQNADVNGAHPFQKSRHFQSVDSMMTSAFSQFDSLLMCGWAINMSSLAPVAASFTPETTISLSSGLPFSAERALQDDQIACQLLGGVIDRFARLKRWGLQKTDDGDVVVSEHSKEGNGGRLALELVSKLCVIRNVPRNKVLQWEPLSPPNMSKFFYFRRPSHKKYGPHQWMWDSCFHIMVDAHSPVDFMGSGEWSTDVQNGNLSFTASTTTAPSPPKYSNPALPNPFRLVSGILELRSLLRLQSPNGFVPEMTYWFPSEHQQGAAQFLFGYSDAEGRATDITQMPMLGMSLQRLFVAIRRLERAVWVSSSPSERGLYIKEASTSTLLLQHFLHKVGGLYRYWVKERDPRDEGLVSIIHPWESGLDASPVYDPVHELHTDVGREGCVSAECAPAYINQSQPPTASSMYPRFISRLYQYRHHRAWSLKAILAHRERFEVQDVGVNAVLAYNIRLLHKLVSRASSRVSKYVGCVDKNALAEIRTELDALVSSADGERIVEAIHSKLVLDDSQGNPVVFSRGWIPTLGAMVHLPADTVQQFFLMLLRDDGDASLPTPYPPPNFLSSSIATT